MEEFLEPCITTGMWEDATITHIENPDQIFAQLNGSSAQLDSLMEQLHVYCDAVPNTINQPQLGMPCIAKFDEDGNWYRAKITGIQHSGMIEVHFVDYGNWSELSANNLKNIPAAYMRLPCQVIQCSLKGVTKKVWNDAETESLLSMCSEPVIVCIGDKVGEGYEVHLFCGRTDINREFGEAIGGLDARFAGPARPPRTIGSIPSPASLEAAQQRAHSTPSISPAVTPKTAQPPKPSNPRASTARDATPRSTPPRGAPTAVDVRLFKPMPLQLGYYDVYVSTINHPSSFFVQLVASERLDALMEKVRSHCKSVPPLDVTRVSVGMQCCAKFSEDQDWYRAIVLSPVSNGSVKVKFPDYGNEDNVALKDLRQITPSIAADDSHAIECCLSRLGPAVGTDWNEKAIEVFEELTLEKQLVLSVIKQRSGGHNLEADLIDTSTPGQQKITALMIKAGMAVEGDTPAPASTSAQQPQPSQHAAAAPSSAAPDSRKVEVKHYRRIHINVGKQVKVMIAHAVSPSQFFCHPVEWINALEELMGSLATQYTAMGPTDLQLTQIRPGAVCAAMFTEDDTWYRAEVIGTEGSKIKVRFVDYGNEELTDIERVKILSNDHLELPAQAIECCLKGVSPPATDWDAAIKDKFVDMIIEKELTASVFAIDRHVHQISLTDGSSDVSQSLQRLIPQSAASSQPGRPAAGKLPSWGSIVDNELGGSGQPTLNASLQPYNIPRGTTFSAHIGWIDSPTSFYVSKVQDTKALEIQQEKLNRTYGSFGPNENSLGDASEGTSCVAKFSEDNSWYRGMVLKVKGPKAQVRFVDYGNKTVQQIANLKSLLAEFAELKIQAIRCQIAGVSEPAGGNWPPHVQQVFEKLMSKQISITVQGQADDKLQVAIEDDRGNDVAELIANNGRPKPKENGFGSSSGGFDRNERGRDRGSGGRDGGFSKPSGGSFGAPAAAASGGSNDWGSGAAQPAPVAAPLSFPAATMPTNGQELEVLMTFVDSLDQFWCQRKSSTVQLDSLMDKLDAFYKSGNAPQQLASPKPGSCCVAKFSEDGGWYRAKVTSPPSGGKVKVQFVDYGNSDECPLTDVKELAKDYAELAAQALHFSLDGLSGIKDPNANMKLEELTMDFECKATITSIQGNKCVVRISADGSSVNEAMRAEFGTSAPQAAAPAPAPVSSPSVQVPPAKIPAEQTLAFVSHIESPDQFYIQLAAIEEELSTYSTEVDAYYQSLQGGSLSSSDVGVGKPCCCLFEDDGAWYRGIMEEVAGSETKVRFLDYGNSQVTPASALKTLAPQFLKPPFAIECSLHGVKSKISGWTEEAMELFSGLVNDKTLEVKFMGAQAPVEVKIVDDGVDVNENMLPYGESKSAAAPKPAAAAAPQAAAAVGIVKYADVQAPSGEVAAFTSHIDDASCFFIQLTSQSDELADYMNTLFEEYSAIDGGQVTDTSIGQACCAKFSEDQGWYRAMIESKLSASTVKIRFVDYGNHEETLTQDIKIVTRPHMKAPYAYRCSLPSAAMNVPKKQFEDAVNEKDLMVKFKSSSAPYIVDISVEGKNLLDVLGVSASAPSVPQQRSSAAPVPTTGGVTFAEKKISPGNLAGYLAHSENPGEFYIQLTESTEDLEALAEAVNEEYANLGAGALEITYPKPGQPCCALYAEDGMWYRATITSVHNKRAQVLFVDYGNSAECDFSSLKSLRPEMIETPPFAICCSLAGCKSEYTAADNDSFLDKIGEEEVQLTVQNNSHPASVIAKVSSGTLNDMFKAAPAPVPTAAAVAEPAATSPAMVSPRLGVASYTDHVINQGPAAAYLAHAESPAHFYVQLSDEADALAEFADSVNAEYCSLTAEEMALESPAVGQPCCALFSDDGMWYRATIKSISGNLADVLFIDYGNSASCEVNGLKIMKPTLAKQAPYAIHCKLAECKDAFTEDETATFIELIGDNELQLNFRNESQPALVTVTVGDVCLNSAYKTQAAAEPQAVAPPEPVVDAPAPEPVVDAPAPAPVADTCTSISTRKIISGALSAYLAHAESPGHFYVQLVEDSDALAEFSESLNTTYSSLGAGELALSSPSVGQACCALFSDDGAWYRATITSLYDDNADVLFVDYGNSSTCTVNNLRALKSDLATQQPYAIHCRLENCKKNFSEEEITQFSEMIGEEEMSLQVKNAELPAVVIVTVGDVTLNDVFAEKPATPEPEPAPRDPSPPVTEAVTAEVPALKFPQKNIAAGNMTAFLSHFNSPLDFYVQLSDEAETLSDFVDQVNNTYTEKGDVLKSPHEGASCVALFDEDENWYRATITSLSGEQATVLFVDYGNSATCGIDHLRIITSEFIAHAPFAIHCRLEGGKDNYSETECAEFSEQIGENEISVEFMSNKPPMIVQVSVEGENLNAKYGVTNDSCQAESKSTEAAAESTQVAVEATEQVAVEATEQATNEADKPVAPPKREIPSGTHKVAVTHIDSPASFYVQLIKEQQTLEDFADKIANHFVDESSTLSSVEIGQVCCALYSEDALWYRATVESIEGDNITVRFMDYGNYETITICSLKKLEGDFLVPPPYAVKCGLLGLPPDKEWTEEDNTKFEEFTIEKDDIEVTFVVEGDKVYVESHDEDLKSIFHNSSDVKACTDDKPTEEATEQPSETTTESVQLTSENITEIKQEITEPMFETPVETPRDLAGSEATDSEYTTPVETPRDLDIDVNNSNSNLELLPKEVIGSNRPRKSSLPCVIPPTEAVEGYVSAVMSPAEFYIHCANDDLRRDDLTGLLNQSYNQSSTQLETVREGQLCCAKFSEDGEWYRAEVKEIADGSMASVLFVDFGNMDDIPCSELKELKPEFLNLSPQAYPCRLKGVEPDSFWEEAHVLAFTELTSDKALTVNFLSTEMPFEVDLNFGEEMSITTEMMLLMTNSECEETSLIEEPSVEDATPTTTAVQEVFPPCEIPTSPTAVTVPHVESLTEIFLNIDSVRLDALMAQLADIYEAQSVTLQDPKPGMPCAVKYCDDDQWYRALVLDLEEENMVNVMFIDYGNCDSVPAGDLKELLDEFIVEPRMAIPACLQNWNEENTDELVEHFIVLTNENALTATFSQCDGRTFVSLRDDDSRDMTALLALSLVEKGAKLTEDPKSAVLDSESASKQARLTWPVLKPDDQLSVYVMPSSSPHNFDCQLAESSGEELPLLQDQIQALYQSGGKSLENFAPGMHCVALFEEDGSWYRAEMTAVNTDKVDVLFVDYGNTESVSLDKIKALDESISHLPRQTFPACLPNILPCNEVWDEATCARFEEITKDKEFICKIVQVHHQSCSIVTVDVDLVDAESQVSVSQSLIDAGYADNVEPITRGNTSKVIRESTMTSLLVDSSRQGESMLADVSHIANDDSLADVSRIANDDSQLEEQMVLLVASVEGNNPDDFTCVLVPNQGDGNESRCDSMRCRLAGIENDIWKPDACAAFERLCQETGDINMKVVGEIEEVFNLVYLYNTCDESGESINARLVSLGHAWLSPTSELSMQLDDIQELEDAQDKLESSFLEVSELHSNSLGSLADVEESPNVVDQQYEFLQDVHHENKTANGNTHSLDSSATNGELDNAHVMNGNLDCDATSDSSSLKKLSNGIVTSDTTNSTLIGAGDS